MRRRGAFTLVEMMVALAVTGVLTVMMLQMFSDSSTIWKSEDDRLDTFREARAALQTMSRELSTTLPMPDVKPATGTDEFPVLALRGRTARSTADLAPAYYTSLYALASTPNSGRSDLCALGYYLEWEPDITPNADTGEAPLANPRSAYALRKQLTPSDTTFGLLAATLTAAAPVFGETAFAKLYAKTTGANTGATTVDTIASYIWDLQFALPTDASTSTSASSGSAIFFGHELPQWVEIRFKALGSNAARRIEGQIVGKDLWSRPGDSTYVRLIAPHEQQFVSRVKLTR